MNRTCPNCGRPGMKAFYEARDISVHSCVMLDDPKAAAAFPRRDLALGFCGTCEFISNVLFDAGVQEYSCGYEEQQAFSPRFRDFQTALVERLIERYDLRGKDVVEIGCGKGDFLVELCRTGGNRGVGIDPACDPKRVEATDRGHVRFIADHYSETYAGLPCDFLCCRHTLEHIHSTNEFVRLMRKVVGDRKDMVVFFEVPDVRRVLGEQAFWDIYYEHCSYFSARSLSRVFRVHRFDVVELGMDYEDQYLLIVARPADDETLPYLPAECDAPSLAPEVESFASGVPRRIESWRSRIAELRSSGKRLAIWGSGSKCVSFLSTLGVNDAIDAIVDINPYRHGKFLAGLGKVVVGPDHLRTHRPDVVFVMNPIYCDEIRRQTEGMGLAAELVPV